MKDYNTYCIVTWYKTERGYMSFSDTYDGYTKREAIEAWRRDNEYAITHQEARIGNIYIERNGRFEEVEFED